MGAHELESAPAEFAVPTRGGFVHAELGAALRVHDAQRSCPRLTPVARGVGNHPLPQTTTTRIPMNKLRNILLLAAVLAVSLPAMAQQKRISPHETISAVVGGRGGNRVTITYGRPYTKDPKTGEARKIWGDLLKWDKAWRLGADEATLLITQKPIVIGETTIPAGADTLYFIPTENGTSKLAFTSNLGPWGVPVDQKHDVARVDAKKEALDTAVDQLTLDITGDDSGGGVIKIRWESTQFSVAFANKK
jgi:hypothetical protein